MSDQTIVIAIGNSDNKLSQAQWSLFYASVDEIVSHYEGLAGITVYGRWVSPSTAPWQNAAWSLGIEDAALPQTRNMQWDLQVVLSAFGQDSLAWTVGHTRLLPAETPSGNFCATCGKGIEWVDAPTGGWWAHHLHPADNHDAVLKEGTP